jgi:HD-like signal output (HDOD) protein
MSARALRVEPSGEGDDPSHIDLRVSEQVVREILNRVVLHAGATSGGASTAARVVAAVDAPATNSYRLAQTISGDPALTARVLRLANSAAFGLSSRVTSVPRAVSVVGFSMVRALALAGAVGGPDTQPGWTEFALLHANAAAHVASRLGATASDAFCAGLMSDLARPLMHREFGFHYTSLCAEVAHPDDLGSLERSAYGFTHEDVAFELFTQWSFPSTIVEAARDHHSLDPAPDSPLSLSVRLAHEVAAQIMGLPARVDIGLLSDGRYTVDDVATYGGALRAQAIEFASVMS